MIFGEISSIPGPGQSFHLIYFQSGRNPHRKDERLVTYEAGRARAMGKVSGHFAFLCVSTVYLAFCASGIKLCTPGCPAVMAWRKSMCYCFFYKDETTTHLSTLCNNPCTTTTFKAENLAVYWPFKWPNPVPVYYRCMETRNNFFGQDIFLHYMQPV